MCRASPEGGQARLFLICDNFLYELLQGHAFGAPGRAVLAGLVQWRGQHAGML